MNARHSIETPRGGAGAIAMIRVCSDDMITLLHQLGLDDLEIGRVRLCDLLGVDSGVVTRWTERSIMLMPHGGQAVVRAISSKLTDLGVAIETRETSPTAVYPEAADTIEARMLGALTLAASPLAVDLLLDQPRRWRAEHEELADGGVLQRLIEPPIVVAVGRANIGKSSLLNSIAGSRVVLVADAAGTTRDHVGVAVDLAGLVVHWVDTPGIDERVQDDDAVTIAVEMVRRAALVVHCIDSADGSGTLDQRLQNAIGEHTTVIRVRTRMDLGGEGGDGLRTSAASGDGLGELVRTLRDRLVPPGVLSDERPWRFWAD